MEHSIEKRSTLKKNPSPLGVITVLIIVLIPFIRYFWYRPVIGTVTGAIVFWGIVTLVIVIIILFLWDRGIKAQDEEKDALDKKLVEEQRQKEREHTKSKKVAIALASVKKERPVRWGDLIYLARFYTLPNEKIDTKNVDFLKTFPFIHLAELRRLILHVDKDGMRWNGADLQVALQLLEEVALYKISVSNELELRRLVEQLKNFLAYCKENKDADPKGYRRILKEVWVHCPTLRKLVHKKKLL